MFDPNVSPQKVTDASLGFVPWAYMRSLMDWKQGEHITIIGPTGQGKTTLGLALLGKRRYKVLVVTKPQDATIDPLKRSGKWHVTRKWPVHSSYRNVILKPPIKGGDTSKQRVVIGDALRSIYDTGSWCVFIDELRHVTDYLGQKHIIELLWMQGRSLGISLVTCAQRPAHVPLLAYDQATHLFLFGDTDETNIKRMGGLGYFNRKEIMQVISTLPKHHILYLNTRDAVMATTKLALPGMER